MDLTWYKSHMFNFGLDMGFMDGALNLTAEYYLRNRTGLLATRSNTLPNTFGADLPQENLDVDRVQGVELSASFDKKISSDWRITASANVNFARSMWVYRERAPFTSSYDRWRNGSAGRASDIVWMYQYAGQFQSEEEIQSWAVQDGQYGNAGELPGDFKYLDVNEDGVINSYDMMPLTTNGTPKIYYGATLGARWKNLDFSMLWQGAALYTVRYTYYYAQPLWGDAAVGVENTYQQGQGQPQRLQSSDHLRPVRQSLRPRAFGRQRQRRLGLSAQPQLYRQSYSNILTV